MYIENVLINLQNYFSLSASKNYLFLAYRSLQVSGFITIRIVMMKFVQTCLGYVKIHIPSRLVSWTSFWVYTLLLLPDSSKRCYDCGNLLSRSLSSRRIFRLNMLKVARRHDCTHNCFLFPNTALFISLYKFFS